MPNKRNRFGEKWSLIHYHSKSFRKYKYWSREQLTAHFGIYYVPPYIQTLNPRRFLVWLIEVVRGNIEVYQPTREYQKDFFKRYHKAIKEATRLPNGLIDEKSISPEFLPYYKHLLRKKNGIGGGPGLLISGIRDYILTSTTLIHIHPLTVGLNIRNQ